MDIVTTGNWRANDTGPAIQVSHEIGVHISTEAGMPTAHLFSLAPKDTALHLTDLMPFESQCIPHLQRVGATAWAEIGNGLPLDIHRRGRSDPRRVRPS